MVEFGNPIIGQEELIRSAIRSQNYQAGVSGWRIAADGSAEFTDLLLTFIGSNGHVEFTNGEMRLYDSNGDLVIIIAPSGVWAVVSTGASHSQYVRLNDSRIEWSNFINPGGISLPGAITWDTSGTNANPTDPAILEISSGYVGAVSSFEAATVTLKGQADGSSPCLLDITGSAPPAFSNGIDVAIEGRLTTTRQESAGIQDTTNRTTASATYATLTGGVAVTIDCPLSGIVMMSHHCRGSHSVANNAIAQSVLITDGGGNLRVASDDQSVTLTSAAGNTNSATYQERLDLVALGATIGAPVTFTVQNRSFGGVATATFPDRRIDVWPLTQ